jgi:hypothetical protein
MEEKKSPLDDVALPLTSDVSNNYGSLAVVNACIMCNILVLINIFQIQNQILAVQYF